MSAYPSLFRPGRIGSLEIKNRLVMAPMVTGGFGPEGELTTRVAEYYAARACGGVGLIICQSSLILRESRAPFRCSIYDDKFIPGFRLVAEAIKENGARAAFQLIHHGSALAEYQALVPDPEEIRPVAPSPVSRLLSTPQSQDQPGEKTDVLPPEATPEDLERIKDGFAQAARRVREAGFEAVEVMAGHGYLLGQFMSPLFNRRTDRYGGSPENRARFAGEVIAAIKDQVGSDFPVLLRISGSEFLPGGLDLEEAARQVPYLVQAGADALHVSAGGPATTDRCYPSYLYPPGPNVYLAETIKKVSRVPVIAVGRIRRPDEAEEILEQGRADFVALGRPLLADPDWPNKARAGRADRVRPCIYCLNCMDFQSHPYLLREGLTCAVNPAVLKERAYELKGVLKPKQVLVVGGGPAGMEAARVLAQRGHRVDLYEKEERLGGQWLYASRQGSKQDDYPRFLEYLERGLSEAGVEVHLKQEVTPELAAQVKPEVIVLAAGARPAPWPVPGADREIVVQALDLLIGRCSAGRRVVVVGGRHLGLEMAEELAGQGREVILITRSALGRDMERNVYLTLRDRLIQKGVQLFPYTTPVRVHEEGLYVVYNHDLVFLKAETIVLATGLVAENRLEEQLRPLASEFYAVGDCVQPRDLMEAVREGAEVGRKI